MTVHVLPRRQGRVAPAFLPAVPDDVLSWLAGELGPDERRAMREIAERADLIFVDGETYLVAPVSPRCIDALAMFEAGAEDREPEPLEPSIDGYDDLEGDTSDYEPDDDNERGYLDQPVPDYPNDPELPQEFGRAP